jgi:carnitine-CoA ligase
MLVARRESRPGLRIGVAGNHVRLDEACNTALTAATLLGEAGLSPGQRIVLVDSTSTNYLVFWMACQFAGLAPALVNPRYPAQLLRQMVADFEPDAVATADGSELLPVRATSVGFGNLHERRLRINGKDVAFPPFSGGRPPGLDSDTLSTAGFMHTSGTTAGPKFCAQSHRYFLELGHYFAHLMELTEDDRILAPLPMFHINPMGYGFIGGLAAGADVLGLEAFIPELLWNQVKTLASSVLVLHGPPVKVLLQRTSPSDAIGHRIRTVFYADETFLDCYRVPAAVSGYGSTEAAGLTHHHLWRRGQSSVHHVPEGISHVGGIARPDIEWKLSSDGEIFIRGKQQGVLFNGYWRDGAIEPTVDDGGWFATGDRGRSVGEELVFVERVSESIRVRGEFIPVEYVERQIAIACPSVDVALWKAGEGQAADEVAILYVAGEHFPLDEIRAAIAVLPRFMRPVEAVRIGAMPVDDTGVGKLRRRLLDQAPVLESCKL